MREKKASKTKKDFPSPIGRFYRFLLGLVLCSFAIVLFLSLISYHTLDPSWNTLIEVSPRNMMKDIGAFLGDFCYQIFGFSSILFVFFIVIWGSYFLLGKRPKRLILKNSILFLSISGFCIFEQWLKPAASGYNALGILLTNLCLNKYIPMWAISLLWGTAGVFGVLWSFSIRPHHIRDFIKRLKGLHLLDKKEAPPTRKTLKKIDPILRKSENVDDEASTQRSIKTYQETTYDSSFEENIRFAQNYLLPPLSLLDATVKIKNTELHNEELLHEKAILLENVLDEFGIKGKIIGVRPGPVVTLFELEPAAGVKSSRVIGLADDIARSMSAVSARVAVVPGKNVIGIELPNSLRETVYLRELLSHQIYESSTYSLSLVLGKDIGGSPMIADLARMPHLLVAGTTGSGKSVAINTMILSLLYRLPPEKCKFIMIDPKMLELSVYDGIPHLLAPVVTDPRKAVVALKWTVREMENRYKSMSKLGVRNIDGYNQKLKEAFEKGEPLVRKVQTGFNKETGEPMFEDQQLEFAELPFIVVVVDEMADLMLVAGKDIEAAVQRLAQMARAAGIHLIMATQRPSVDVITGTIKANFPTRMSFQVTSKIDSRTILGEQGAEQLLGQGDMLYMVGGGRITRVHGAFVSDQEVERVVSFLKSQAEPKYIEGLTEEDEDMELSVSPDRDEKDELYRQALDIVLGDGKASTSYIQRKLQIGYNRAARLIEQMEEEGVVSAPNHVGKREILLKY